MPTDIPSVATFSMQGIDPIHDPTTAATFWLRRDIIRGVFLPGEKLKTEQLARFYKIGHMPIRAAILHVSANGLITHEHMRGHRVAAVSPDDFSDQIETYHMILKAVLDRAFARRHPIWHEQVALSLFRLLQVPYVPLREDPEAHEQFLWMRRETFLAVVSTTGATALTRFLGNLSYRVGQYVQVFGEQAVMESQDFETVHRAMHEALVARDFVRVRRIVEKSYSIQDAIQRSVIEGLTNHGAAARPSNPHKSAKRPRPKRVAKSRWGTRRNKVRSSTRRR